MKAAFLPLYKQSVKWSWGKNGNKINLNLRNLLDVWEARWMEHGTLDLGVVSLSPMLGI